MPSFTRKQFAASGYEERGTKIDVRVLVLMLCDAPVISGSLTQATYYTRTRAVHILTSSKEK